MKGLNYSFHKGTITGPVWEDTFQLGSLSGSARFGAITYQTKDFQQLDVVDGIIGLACSSSFDRPTPLYELADSGMV